MGGERGPGDQKRGPKESWVSKTGLGCQKQGLGVENGSWVSKGVMSGGRGPGDREQSPRHRKQGLGVEMGHGCRKRVGNGLGLSKTSPGHGNGPGLSKTSPGQLKTRLGWRKKSRGAENKAWASIGVMGGERGPGFRKHA